MAFVVCSQPGNGFRDNYLAIYPDGTRTYTSVRRWATRFSAKSLDDAMKLAKRDNPRYPVVAKRDRGRQQDANWRFRDEVEKTLKRLIG